MRVEAAAVAVLAALVAADTAAVAAVGVNARCDRALKKTEKGRKFPDLLQFFNVLKTFRTYRKGKMDKKVVAYDKNSRSGRR